MVFKGINLEQDLARGGDPPANEQLGKGGRGWPLEQMGRIEKNGEKQTHTHHTER